MLTSPIQYKANDDDYEMQMMPMLTQPFMTLVKNDTHNRIELHLRGEFGSPQQSSKELTELSHLSEKYPTCLVYINSVGGRVDLLREIVALLEKFQSVITVVTSNANSAGLMLWAVGDIRVVCPYAELMAHREASGYADKTDALVERAEFLKRRFELMFSDMCGDVLTEEEISRARFTEVWLLGKDLIERGAAISWEQFHVQDTAPIEMMAVISRNGKMYVNSTDGNLFEANVDVDQTKIISYMDVMYGIDPPACLDLTELEADDSIEEKTEAKSVMATQKELLDPLVKVVDGMIVSRDSDAAVIREDELRLILRAVFGKGNFKIGKNIQAKIDGKFYQIGGYFRPSKLDRLSFYEDLNDLIEEHNISLPTEE